MSSENNVKLFRNTQRHSILVIRRMLEEQIELGEVQSMGGSCTFKPNGMFLFSEEIGIVKNICDNFYLFYDNILTGSSEA
jgi:hypothetical protein